jgi:hypothetical protein
MPGELCLKISFFASGRSVSAGGLRENFFGGTGFETEFPANSSHENKQCQLQLAIALSFPSCRGIISSVSVPFDASETLFSS